MASFIIEALQNKECFNHPVTGFSVIETHISWVLLTGPYAYKIKKPLNLGFLDFSTLEKRRSSCEEEVRINKRLCPDLYIGVVSLSGDPYFPTLNGSEPPFEYMVKMKQFDQSFLLDRLIKKGVFKDEWMERVAREAAAFHVSAPALTDTSDLGTPSSFWKTVSLTLDQLTSLVKDTKSKEDVQKLARWVEKEFNACTPLMEKRRASGFVREGHGDMHLRNIALSGPEDPLVYIFDAIEFDPNLRWIDVMNDAAFLFMDCHAHKRADLGWRFLNRYLEQTGDYDGLRLLNLYSAIRALVRANVLAMQQQESEGGAHLTALSAEIQNFISTAAGFTHRSPPHLSITHGPSGSGKTTVTHHVMIDQQAIRLRSDIERKRRPRTLDLPAVDLYSPKEINQTYQYLHDVAGRLLDQHYNVIVDATFLKKHHRNLFHQLAKSKQVPFHILDFMAPENILRKRIRQRSVRDHDASEATEEVLTQQLKTCDPLTTDETRFVIVGLDANRH